MAGILEFIKSIYKAWTNVPVTVLNPKTGPDTLDELLKQFDLPKKEKTSADIIRDYQIKETLAALEVDMLKLEPSIVFRGFQKWFDNQGNTFFDWVPCVVRPETLYCAYGKN